MSPADGEDLTVIVEAEGHNFIVLRSPATAEYDPDYQQLGSFHTRQDAEMCVARYDQS